MKLSTRHKIVQFSVKQEMKKYREALLNVNLEEFLMIVTGAIDAKNAILVYDISEGSKFVFKSAFSSSKVNFDSSEVIWEELFQLCTGTMWQTFQELIKDPSTNAMGNGIYFWRLIFLSMLFPKLNDFGNQFIGIIDSRKEAFQKLVASRIEEVESGEFPAIHEITEQNLEGMREMANGDRFLTNEMPEYFS